MLFACCVLNRSLTTKSWYRKKHFTRLKFQQIFLFAPAIADWSFNKYFFSHQPFIVCIVKGILHLWILSTEWIYFFSNSCFANTNNSFDDYYGQRYWDNFRLIHTFSTQVSGHRLLKDLKLQSSFLLETLSPLKPFYFALNDQILKLRSNLSVRFSEIPGNDFADVGLS